jgi:hypothetical protein
LSIQNLYSAETSFKSGGKIWTFFAHAKEKLHDKKKKKMKRENDTRWKFMTPNK